MLTENTPCIVEGWCQNGGAYYREYKTIKEAAMIHNTRDVYFWTVDGHQLKTKFIRKTQNESDK